MSGEEYGEDEANLEAALLDLGTTQYQAIRADLIRRLGYDQFREIQNRIFKRIGTIAFEKSQTNES